MKNKLQKIFNKYIRLSIKDITLGGIFVGLYIISYTFISLNLQGLMHVGISFVFLIMFGLFFGPIKGVFLALIADTIAISISSMGLGSWMWEYEIITVGIPLMSWGFKYLFDSKQKYWWFSMIIINTITLLGMITVMVISSHNDVMKNASHNSFKFDNPTFILIYVMAGLTIITQSAFFIYYKIRPNEQLKLTISIATLVMMTIVIWIWIWGPIAYVRYLQRLAASGYAHFPSEHYTYGAYYKIALWARILKTPVIVPLYTVILIPLYKATEIASNKLKQNGY